MKGRARRWAAADRTRLARFDGQEIVRLTEWYTANVPGAPAWLIHASGALPGTPAPAANRGGPSVADDALAAFAEQALVPPFTWSDATRFYFDVNGRGVSWSLVNGARDTARLALEAEARLQSERMVAGEITIGQWQEAMAETVKMGHGTAAMLVLGGWAALEASDWAEVEVGIDFQLEYLDGFAQALESAEYPVDGLFWQRVGQYPKSLRKAWWHLTGSEMFKRGYDMEMNILGGAENCEDCLWMSELGWQPQGELIDIGDRQCLNACSCEIQYRSSFTGKTWQNEIAT